MKQWLVILIAIAVALIGAFTGKQVTLPNIPPPAPKGSILVRDTCFTLDSAGNIKIIEVLEVDCPTKVRCADTTGWGAQRHLYLTTIVRLRSDNAKLVAENARLRPFEWAISRDTLKDVWREADTINHYWYRFIAYDTSTLLLTEVFDSLQFQIDRTHKRFLFFGKNRYRVHAKHTNPLIVPRYETLDVPELRR